MTPEELKHNFNLRGITFRKWAEENGYPPIEVYKVINGLSKAKRGQGHEIAVKLGLKPSHP